MGRKSACRLHLLLERRADYLLYKSGSIESKKKTVAFFFPFTFRCHSWKKNEWMNLKASFT